MPRGSDKNRHYVNGGWVIDLNERLRYLCRSDSKKDDWHMVDLGDRTCTCEDFTFVRKGSPRASSRRDCKHIIRAKLVFADKILNEIVHQTKKQEERGRG